ncbi:hypothetical protein [Paenibacillus agricola]|uniref:Uncharacterized protein n=1 Tax=Paenibacillus agricola TaxID=2716264 RepID=A0ABX0JG97_9BACL|nr:hypothetical protein [Paenibacillus agricola]NHN35585.1 hypothetical protein [Paenibacillus agricola]
MDIIGDVKRNITSLEKLKDALDQIDSDNVDLEMFKKYTIERSIADYNQKLEKMTYKKFPHRCELCQQWIEELEPEQKSIMICQTCRVNLPKTMTTNEIEPLWGLHVGKIKQDIDNHLLDDFIDAGLIWKSGRYWLIHELVMQKHYERKLGYKRGS